MTPAQPELSNQSQDTRSGRRNRPPAQREKVAGMLVGTEAVCATTFLRIRIPRYAAHVHQLRKAGWVILTRQCSRPWHSHETYQVEYVVEALPFEPHDR